MKTLQWLFIACSKSQCPYQTHKTRLPFFHIALSFWPHLLPALSVSATLASLLFLKHCSYTPTSGPLHLLAPQPVKLFSHGLSHYLLQVSLFMLPLAVRLYFPFSCLLPPLPPFSALLYVPFVSSAPLWRSKYLLVWLSAANSMRAGTLSTL